MARNRKARHDYEVLDTFEAGIQLVGPEVKSLRAGQVSLVDSYATIVKGEVWLRNLHISPYTEAGRHNVDPKRERKLLMHRHEIKKLASQAAERGNTLVPLGLYFRDGRAKVELGLVRGRRRHDKRQAIRKREEDREASRAMRRSRR